MSLNMQGHVDAVFRSTDVVAHIEAGGSYVDGLWVEGAVRDITFNRVTIQPLNDKELDFLYRGNERILDSRKLYINNGDLESLTLANDVTFVGLKWKISKSDIRPWRSYAKLIVVRYDDQPS